MNEMPQTQMTENVRHEQSVDDAPLHYSDLVQRYGETVAYDLLMTIEKLAKIQEEMAMAFASYEERLQRAMGRLESINYSMMT